MKQFINVLLEIASLFGIVACKQKCLFQFATNGWSFFVNLHLVPSLLQKICTIVITAVCIAECDVFQIVIRFSKRIAYGIWKYRMLTCNHVHQHTFARSISADNSYVLAFFKTEVYRFSQTPFRLPCDCIS